MNLEKFFTDNPNVAIAFSGGVDSTYLIYAAKKYAQRVKAYLVQSSFQPNFEIQEALEFAMKLGVELHVEPVDILANRSVAANPANRCYLCKQNIFGKIWELARADGFGVLCDGTNASDDYDDRPGMKALKELGVRSPLREAGLTKADIRVLSEKANLPTYNKPSYACLATRVPTGTLITQKILNKVELAEDALFEMGYGGFRVRYLGDSAKLEFPQADLPSVIEHREEIVQKLSPYFDNVYLDLKPRKGD